MKFSETKKILFFNLKYFIIFKYISKMYELWKVLFLKCGLQTYRLMGKVIQRGAQLLKIRTVF